MKPYKCQVCGELYLSADAPDRCPYCGAAGSELKQAELWYDRGVLNLSQVSRDNLQRALDLEVHNVGFYQSAGNKAQNHANQSIFKRLAKHEQEHAELICKAMGISIPPIPQVEAKNTDSENYIEANRYETEAVNFYLKAASDGGANNEPEVAYIFRCLAEIEKEHSILSNLYR